jgi:hypothetical protein
VYSIKNPLPETSQRVRVVKTELRIYLAAGKVSRSTAPSRPVAPKTARTCASFGRGYDIFIVMLTENLIKLADFTHFCLKYQQYKKRNLCCQVFF